MDPTVDISECTVAEKAHYFEEQIQKETTAARGTLKSQSSQESARIAAARLSGISISSEDDRSLEAFEETERILEEKAQKETVDSKLEQIEVKTWQHSKEEKKDDEMEKGKKNEIKEEEKVCDFSKDLKSDKYLEKDDLIKKDIRTKNIDGKVVRQKEIIKDEKLVGKQKLKDSKDCYEKKQDTVEEKSRKTSKSEKDLLHFKKEGKETKIEHEKKESEKKISQEQKHDSSIKSKLESDIHNKETKKTDKTITEEKGNCKTKIIAKVDTDKENKAKATKMQENVSKQQKAAECKSPSTSIKSTKGKEEISSRINVVKQKSKEETLPKPVPTKQRSKEEPFSKSPPKKDKSKEDSLSKSPPKKDKFKDETISKFSPKSEKFKETSSSKSQSKSEKVQDLSPQKFLTKKETLKTELSKTITPQKDELKEDSTKNVTLKDIKYETTITSELKISKSKEEVSKSEILIVQAPKNDFDINFPPSDVKQDSSELQKVLEKPDDNIKSENENDLIGKTKNEKTLIENEKQDTSFPDKTTESVTLKEIKTEKIESDITNSVISLKSNNHSNVESTGIYKSQNLQSQPIDEITKLTVEKNKICHDQADIKGTVITAKEQEDKFQNEKTKEESDIGIFKSEKDENLSASSLRNKLETCVGEKPQSIITKCEKSKEEFSRKSFSVHEKENQTLNDSLFKEDKSVDKTFESIVLGKGKSMEESSIKSTLKDYKEKNVSSVSLSMQEKTIDEIPKSMLSKSEDSKEELPKKLSSKDDKIKDTSITSLPKPEKPMHEIHQTLITSKEESIEEYSIKSSSNDGKGKNEALTCLPKQEKSISEISQSMIPKREEYKEEIFVNSPLKDDTDQNVLSTSVSKEKKATDDITKSMLSEGEKSKEEFLTKSLSRDTKEREVLKDTLSMQDKFKDEVAKSMIPRREQSKEEFSIKTSPKNEKCRTVPVVALSKREKSKDEIPKTMIPKREKSKEEFSVKSLSAHNKDKQAPTHYSYKQDKPNDNISESLLLGKEVFSIEESSIKSSLKANEDKNVPTESFSKQEESMDGMLNSMLSEAETSVEELSIKSCSADANEQEALIDSLSQQDKFKAEIPKSMIPRREKSKEEFSIKLFKNEKSETVPPAALLKREISMDEIPKTMIPKREKSKEEFSVKSPSTDKDKQASTHFSYKQDQPNDKVPETIILGLKQSVEDSSLKFHPKDHEDTNILSTSLSKREKSIGEIPKSMIPRREKSKEEFSIKSSLEDDKGKDLPPTSLPKREKSIDEIPKSMIPRTEKSKEEFSIKSPLKDDKGKDLPSASPPKREKSLGEIPRSMIPRREKSKEEFSIKSPGKDDKGKDLPSSSLPKREKSIDEIPKSMIPRREKSKEEFSIKSSLEDDKGKDLPPTSLPKREKSIDEIPKSMIPRTEKSKEEFSIKSPLKDDKGKDLPSASPPKREKSLGEIPRSMIPRREKSKEEFSIKSPGKDDKGKDLPSSSLPKREKSIDEIPKSMIPRREKSKEEFSIKSTLKDDNGKDIPSTSPPKREKSIGEIPKSMIPRREKSKEEFSIKSSLEDDKGRDLPSTSLPKREKSIGEISKSMIPKREKSKEEFSIKSPGKDDKGKDLPSSSLPKREKSIDEIPKSMIPRREKSKEEFSIKSTMKDDNGKDIPSISPPKREKSIGEIPKSMIPRREKSKEEFSIKSPLKDDKSKNLPATSLPKREKSLGEIPKSMIPRREKSKEEFSIKSPLKDDKGKDLPSTFLPKREKSIGEISKSMIPKREKSKEEFSIKSPVKDDKGKDLPSTSLPKREKSIGEIPKSMIPRREKSKEEFSIKSSRKDDKDKDLPPTSVPKREKSIGEIPKSMIPKREKSKEEFTIKSSPKSDKGKDLPSTALPKREKSVGEIPKSMIPRRDSSKEEFSINLAKDKSKETPLTSVKLEKSSLDVSKSVISKTESSKEQFCLKSPPKCSKAMSFPSNVPKQETYKGDFRKKKPDEEFSFRLPPKREKSKEEMTTKLNLKRNNSKTEQSIKSTTKKTEIAMKATPKRENSKELMPSKSSSNRRDSKDELLKSSNKKVVDSVSKNISKRELSKEDSVKMSTTKRRDSKDESSKSLLRRSSSSRDSDSKSPSLKSNSPSPKAEVKLPKKDVSPKKEFEAITITKKQKSEETITQKYEEHTTKHSSQSQIFSGTFTRDAKEALKLFEDTSALKNADLITSEDILSSEVNLKETISVADKVLKSSEIDTEETKIIVTDKKEDMQRIEMSEISRQLPEKKQEKSETKIETTLVHSDNDLEIVQGSDSQIGQESKQGLTYRSIEDEKKITTSAEDSGLPQDLSVGDQQNPNENLRDGITEIDDCGEAIEKIIFEEELTDIAKTSDKNHDFKTESSGICQSVCHIDGSAIDKAQGIVQSPECGTIASETFHDELADDLTKKFETLMCKSIEAEQDFSNSGSFTQELDIESSRISVSISSEDMTKDESSSFQLSLSQAKIPEDITISASSISEQVEVQKPIKNDICAQNSSTLNASETVSSLEDVKIGSKTTIEGKFISEISGARVLEILEPENESQSRQDSMDVSSIEVDDIKYSSGAHDFPLIGEILHESPPVDSFETLERDITISSVTFSEDTNIDYSLPQDSHKKQNTSLPKISIKRKTERDSFEIESPPLISPRMKVKDLEIKPVDWMIGDEKIEVSEHLEPSAAFNKELEEYQSLLKLQQKHDEFMESKTVTNQFDIPKIEESSSFLTNEPELLKLNIKPKFIVIPVNEQDFEIEKDLVENELDISCQELIDTLQQEHDAKTPIDDRFEEIAARSFHFTTVDDEEDNFDKDKERSERKEKLVLDSSQDEKFCLPLETKTAVNVIEREQFFHLDEHIRTTDVAGDTNTDKLVQMYEEQFDFKSDGEDKEVVERTENLKISKCTDSQIKNKNNASDIENLYEFQQSNTLADSLQEKSSAFFVTEIGSEDEMSNQQSYDLKNVENQSEKSEILLKLKTEQLESEDKKAIQLVSYKVFDAEEGKKHTESHGVTGIHKPLKNEFHKEGKVDIRSKGWDDHNRSVEKREKSHSAHQDGSHYKIKKDDFQNVDMSSRYAIKVLDQVVKKEIAEVKENLEAAKQDLIEELSENSENVIQIKDSPSEFQFKLQPESIPNELPFLYKAPSLEKVGEIENLSLSSSPVAKPRRHGELIRDRDESSSDSSSVEKKVSDITKTSIIVENIPDKSPQKETKDVPQSYSSSPKAASRSGSDVEGGNRDESFSLQPPQPAPRRRQKSSRGHHNVTSESEADVSSSGESNYLSCEYESASRPSSSDIEALQSPVQLTSITASEYETAAMSFEHSSSKVTSQDYHTAANTLSSKESMKSLNSLSSGQMGSLDSTSEISETLIASESDLDKDAVDENLECILDDDMKTFNYGSDDEGEKPFDLDPNIPCMMKRSSEMIFSQVINSESSNEEENWNTKLNETFTLMASDDASKSDISTKIEGTENKESSNLVSKQTLENIYDQTTSLYETIDAKTNSCSFEPDSLETKCTTIQNIDDESLEDYGPGSGLTLQQQLSMTSSSMSGVSLETVIEKDQADRQSPNSDSFELVDKPDIIDDFVVVEEVGREAEEFDCEGRGMRINATSYTSSKHYDREVENLITEKQETQKIQAGSTRSSGDLFDFESEESPPQASNEEQYSQSYSDEEQYNDGGKKWIEMQFQHNEARLYDLEYERGPLEDIKEEEVTDFEASSSRFGSIGSQKESIGSIGSMRGSFGSTPDNYDVLTAKRYFKPTDHDNVSLSSLQEFEHLENAVALENAKRREQQHSSSQDSSSNGSLPRRYITSRSGHGDDISLSSVKDFEVLEKACKEAHLIELKAREEEDLLDHESPENRYKLENLARVKIESQESASGSFNPSTSGSDDYEKRIKEIDEIIRLAQVNVEKMDKHDDTTDDVSQIDLTDTADKVTAPITIFASETSAIHEPPKSISETNVMETSTDSLELEDHGERNYNMCRSSDSLELKTALDHPSISSDSLNNVKDPKEEQSRQFSSTRRISSDSLDNPVLESQDINMEGKGKNSMRES